MTLHRPRHALLLAALMLAAVPSAQAQSETASRASGTSLLASGEVPVAAAQALSAGATFSVTAMQASGEVVLLTLQGAAEGSALVIRVAAVTVRDLGLGVGTGVVASAVATGWVLSAAGEAIAYVADEATRPLIHSRRLSP